jgi:hypothetical protein
MIALWKQADRGKAFIRRCRLVKVAGVSLHSYRYAWAERAKRAGYPERFAQEALGHNSKAVHRAYARNAQVTIPPLEEYEQERERKIVPLPNLTHVSASLPLSTQAARYAGDVPDPRGGIRHIIPSKARY